MGKAGDSIMAKEGIHITRGEKIPGQFQKFAERFPRTAVEHFRWIMDRGVKLTVDNIAGKVLKARPDGDLAKSIKRAFRAGGREWKGSWFSEVVYARILHDGGTIKHPGSHVRTKKALHFHLKNGDEIFCKSTRPHDITIPPRPYMEPAVIKAMDEGLKRLWNTIERAI